MGWGDILKAFSFAAPVGQTLGPMMERGAAINELDTRRAATEKGYATLINALPDEYKPLKDALAGGAPASALMPALQGPFGSIMEHAQRMGRISRLFPDDKAWHDPARWEAAFAEDPDLLKGAPPGLQEQVFPKPKTTEAKMAYGMPEEAFNALPTQAARDERIKTYTDLTTKLPAPGKPKVQVGSGEDPSSGYAYTTRELYDDSGAPIPGTRRITGVSLGPTQKADLAQARQVLNGIPRAAASARAVQDILDGRNPGDETAQRDMMKAQYQAYIAQKKYAEANPATPYGWFESAWYRRYGNPDPTFVRYFDDTGQLLQQIAAPMHIFRSQGIFDNITPHIPKPQDLPSVNLEHLYTIQQRWTGDWQRLIALQNRVGQQVGATMDPTAGIPELAAPLPPVSTSGPRPGEIRDGPGGKIIWGP